MEALLITVNLTYLANILNFGLNNFDKVMRKYKKS